MVHRVLVVHQATKVCRVHKVTVVLRVHRVLVAVRATKACRVHRVA